MCTGIFEQSSEKQKGANPLTVAEMPSLSRPWMNAENDAVYLPLKKDQNELVLAVSELTGGWGLSAGFSEALWHMLNC